MEHLRVAPDDCQRLGRDGWLGVHATQHMQALRGERGRAAASERTSGDMSVARRTSASAFADCDSQRPVPSRQSRGELLDTAPTIELGWPSGLTSSGAVTREVGLE